MATTPVFNIIPPYTPELLKSVQVYLKTYIQPIEYPSILELGSGYSTIWFAMLRGIVLSVEHDRGWYQEVRKVLLENDLMQKVVLCHANPEKFSTLVKKSIDSIYDVVLIDCIDEQRKNCARAAMTKVKSQGLLVIDDSHWDDLKPLAEELKEWKSIEFQGMHERKTGEIQYHQTTIYIKP